VRQIDEGVPLAAADPREPFVAPKKPETPPFFDFSPLENASAALEAAAGTIRPALAAASDAASDPARVARINALLRGIERVADALMKAARPFLVPALRVRARLLHRLRGQDASSRARSDRATAVDFRQPPDRP
jgi:hypothetical protein